MGYSMGAQARKISSSYHILAMFLLTKDLHARRTRKDLRLDEFVQFFFETARKDSDAHKATPQALLWDKYAAAKPSMTGKRFKFLKEAYDYWDKQFRMK
jgi:hypothetical protein